MSRKNQYVAPTGIGLGVRGEGNDRRTAKYKTQREVIERGRDIWCKEVQLRQPRYFFSFKLKVLPL